MVCSGVFGPGDAHRAKRPVRSWAFWVSRRPAQRCLATMPMRSLGGVQPRPGQTPMPAVRQCRAPHPGPVPWAMALLFGVLDSRFPCPFPLVPRQWPSHQPVQRSCPFVVGRGDAHHAQRRWLAGRRPVCAVLCARRLHPCSVWDLDRGACMTGCASRQPDRQRRGTAQGQSCLDPATVVAAASFWGRRLADAERPTLGIVAIGQTTRDFCPEFCR